MAGDECELSSNLLLNLAQLSLAAELNVLRSVQPPAQVSQAIAAERRDRGRNLHIIESVPAHTDATARRFALPQQPAERRRRRGTRM